MMAGGWWDAIPVENHPHGCDCPIHQPGRPTSAWGEPIYQRSYHCPECGASILGYDRVQQHHDWHASLSSDR